MYVVNLIYKKDAAAVDKVRDEHLSWLKKQFAEGFFIASGVKVPKTGGLILVKDMPRYKLDDLLATDPFQEVADYVVIEVKIGNAAPEFKSLIGL